MKTAAFIIFGFVMLSVSSCDPTATQREEHRIADSIKVADSLAMVMAEMQRVTDSITMVEMVSANTIESKEALDTIIAIKKFYCSEPNSACGVDVNIIWQNKSKRTVKYIYFYVYPYNAVGDIVQSEIGDKDRAGLKSTGPINPNQTDGYGTSWETVWYNCSIKKIKIASISIDYMDGTTISIPEKFL